MNAPDKIFLHKVRDEESSGYHKMWFESRGRLVPSEEYIRKDALLKWAKRLKEKWEEPPMSRHSPGCVFMLEQVIKKIESL